MSLGIHAPKTKTCAACLEPFTPARPMQSVCSPRCAHKKVRLDKAKEREVVRERKKALETIPDLIKAAQAAVNKYCRLRDIYAGRGCISCGATHRTAFGGAFDAGHWRSVGSAPHLRFYTKQIRLQCVRCNRHLGGNAVEFRKGLVALFGVEEVERIESMQGTLKPSADYLRRLAGVMRKKSRRLEKKIA
jgi:hypothetical protein